MNAPSLQRLTILSLIFHITLFSLTLLTARKSVNFTIPSPYVVNLVEAENSSRQSAGETAAPQPTPKTEAVKDTRAAQKARDNRPIQKSKVSEEQYISERIAALKAKKRIEEIGRLRNIISLKGHGPKGSGSDKRTEAADVASGKGAGRMIDDYEMRITKEIQQHWIFPETGDKTLEAIILVKVMKDGSVRIMGIEKSSGNPLFDRSALRAITRASPLTPPPSEMEIGVRFYP